MNEKKQSVFFKAWPLIVALGVALALVGGLNLLWWRLNQKEEQSVAWVEHKEKVIFLLNEMQNNARNLLVGQRSFALTRDHELLGPYNSATTALPEIMGNLKELVRDNAGEWTLYLQLQTLITHYVKINREHLDLLVNGDPMAPDTVFREQVQDSLDSIRLIHHKMEAEENAAENAQRSELMRTVRDVTQLNLAGGVIGVVMIFVAVAALWGENRRRRAVEIALRLSHDELEKRVQERTASLRENQARLQLAQAAARIGTFEWNLRTGDIIRSKELAAMYGLPSDRLTQAREEWLKMIHPDDRPLVEAWSQQARDTAQTVEGEWRVIWPDGSVHWLFGRWQVFQDENGRPLNMIGVNMDITERKRLEEDLMQASDNEMRRIGHDLHDGVGQQLTALTLFNASLRAGLGETASPLATGLQKLGEGLHEIVREIRVLSHGLAPVPISENGLTDALQQLASDTSSMALVECEFVNGGSVALEDRQQAAQLYRIAQEAVNNALKHSEASKISISLQALAGGWELVVADNGRGFQDNGRSETGLGLRAMRHRAGLMGVRFKVESRPGAGTQVICSGQRRNQIKT